MHRAGGARPFCCSVASFITAPCYSNGAVGSVTLHRATVNRWNPVGIRTLGILYSGWVRTLGILCGGKGRGVCGVASRLVALTRDWLVGVNILDVVTYVRRSMPSN